MHKGTAAALADPSPPLPSPPLPFSYYLTLIIYLPESVHAGVAWSDITKPMKQSPMLLVTFLETPVPLFYFLIVSCCFNKITLGHKMWVLTYKFVLEITSICFLFCLCFRR